MRKLYFPWWRVVPVIGWLVCLQVWLDKDDSLIPFCKVRWQGFEQEKETQGEESKWSNKRKHSQRDRKGWLVGNKGWSQEIIEVAFKPGSQSRLGFGGGL